MCLIGRASKHIRNKCVKIFGNSLNDENMIIHHSCIVCSAQSDPGVENNEHTLPDIGVKDSNLLQAVAPGPGLIRDREPAHNS